MTSRPSPHTLVVDVGGTHVKLLATGKRTPIKIDSGYRTPEHNKAVGGAADSRHTHADAADFFSAQVDSWIAQGTAKDRAAVLAIANRIFSSGGVGNETSGTLHVDARGWKARFITWVAAK